MLKFKLWISLSTVKNKIIHLYNGRFCRWIRTTLIFNISKVFIIIMCLLLIIFLLSPHTAHLSYNDNATTGFGNIITEYISMDLTTEKLTLSIPSSMEITCQGIDYFQVDNMTYTSDCKLIVEPINEYSLIFVDMNKSSDVKMKSYYNQYETLKPITIDTISPEMTINYPNGLNLTLKENIHLYFCDINAFIVNDENKVSIDSCNIVKHEFTDCTLYFSGETTFQAKNILDSNIKNASIELLNIKQLASMGSGTLFFSYTATPKNYTLHNQILKVKSKEYGLNATVSLTDKINNFQLNGIVNSALLSNISLFPSFTGWYRDNIYLAPLTLVTTVFGGVSLKTKKQKDQL